MQQILKQLELIKTSISIEDEEIIELQVTKLSIMTIDDQTIREITTKARENKNLIFSGMRI